MFPDIWYKISTHRLLFSNENNSTYFFTPSPFSPRLGRGILRVPLCGSSSAGHPLTSDGTWRSPRGRVWLSLQDAVSGQGR